MAKRYHGIIKQPSNNRSNLPQDVMIKDVSTIPCGGNYSYDDTMGGIDEKMNKDITGINRKDKAGRW